MINYDDDVWQSLISPLYSNLPVSAAELSEVLLGYSLWLQDEKDDPGCAHIKLRLSLLYKWIHLAGRKPEAVIRGNTIQVAWAVDSDPPGTCPTPMAMLPFWLAQHIPMESYGVNVFDNRQDRWVNIICSPGMIWTLLEVAAIECPDFITLIQEEINSLLLSRKGDRKGVVSTIIGNQQC